MSFEGMSSRSNETRERESLSQKNSLHEVKKAIHVKVRTISYNEAYFEEREAQTLTECLPSEDKTTVTWINVDGIHEPQIIEEIGKRFGLHPLVVEDITRTGQRPRTEDFENYIFIVLNMISYSPEDNEIMSEQVSMVLASNYLITFQEKEGDVFDSTREMIRKNKGRIRRMGTDYLAYALIDAAVEKYFETLEGIGDRIEFLEEDLVTNPTPETLQAIHNLKTNMIVLRKSVWPLREAIGSLERRESPLIRSSTLIYFRDLYGHTIQVMDTVDTLRDMISGMLDIYLSSVSNKMNEIMKVLTIIATIFIPLTLVSGIYGMNFRYMPELDWLWGYPMVLAIMTVVATIMLVYFRKRKWL